MGIKRMSQGWTDIQMITSLVLLNVAGGESVSDLDVLEGDEGLGRLLRRMETHGMRRCEREAMDQRWRVGRQRSVPSASAVFRYLDKFHDAGEEAKRESGRAFIPAATDGLRGLNRVNADMVAFVQRHEGNETRQLAMDLGFTPVVPPLKLRTAPWQYDRELYKRRNEVQRLIRGLKGFWRIFSRFDKLATLFTGFILAALNSDGLR